MDVVKKFLQLRRDGKGEEAYEMLAPGATFASPWGGLQYGARAHDILVDEARFTKRGHLVDAPIEQIGENTFQRKYQFDRGVFETGNVGWSWFHFYPTWRELYFVEHGQIRLVTIDKVPQKKFLRDFLGL
ncbi:hypothetical protein STCU_00794 [Strigomonas culicis]|uniref:Uncharacterized protein n=1 Tax=Strigomonas culicis TaxID=28005 RepID=S9W9Q9_9TRYP|nr:hypothetical protein STCU_02711 [Strigomonas culicis]EPY35629.1 hypothetical protein STCU_01045 [Strigomonas culicis]EPY36021.1 hypothetical protein STCU_00794 [Strigomonas culicis]|eukprot:EPY32726.1 hypothetical protein STCU_02711 [Strigomonas culicis]